MGRRRGAAVPEMPYQVRHDDAMPSGLVSIGGDLQPESLLAAYSRGVFPWSGDGEPILWWRPDLRAVLLPGDLHIARRLRRFINNSTWHLRCDSCFDRVLECCAQRGTEGTWLRHDLRDSLSALHGRGLAHSLEVWDDDSLVGGIYGLQVRSVFCGESMFSQRSNASKVAFVALVRRIFAAGFLCLDAQAANPHTRSLGVRDVPCLQYLQMLAHPQTPAWPFAGDERIAVRELLHADRRRQPQSRPQPAHSG